MKRVLLTFGLCLFISLSPKSSFGVGPAGRCFQAFKPTLATAIPSILTGLTNAICVMNEVYGRNTAIAVGVIGGAELFLLRPILDPEGDHGATLIRRCSNLASGCVQGARSASAALSSIPPYLRGLCASRPNAQVEYVAPLAEVRVIQEARVLQAVVRPDYQSFAEEEKQEEGTREGIPAQLSPPAQPVPSASPENIIINMANGETDSDEEQPGRAR